MRITLENTTKIVDLTLDGQTFPARVWEGQTASGIPCHAYITRIAVHRDQDATQFAAELLEQRTPSAAIAELPARIVL